MKKRKFEVEIHVKAYRVVEIEARTQEEAEELAEERFQNGDPLIDDGEYQAEFFAYPKKRQGNS